MCGIAGIFGAGCSSRTLHAMVAAQVHRGPDDGGVYVSPCGTAGLGHRRLSIIDLSSAGHQPMRSASGHLWVAFNGEIYNYRELRAQLRGYRFRTATDTEVILAAYERWGSDCVNRFRGMFAFLIWDEVNRTAFGARDPFGIKPFYYSDSGNTLLVSSEIKALHAAGVAPEPDERAWSDYLSRGYHDHSSRTFWRDVTSLPAGCTLHWRDGKTQISRWYSLPDRVDRNARVPDAAAAIETYRELLEESVTLRFRSDVPVGINLSGGLDSSVLLGIVQRVQGESSNAHVYTFATGDERYDELPWVRQMLAHTQHPASICMIRPQDVPELAASVQLSEDEPYGGLPTLAYAKLFETARTEGAIVLLDGQGMDEQWAGYDYYGSAPSAGEISVQGTSSRAVRPECLTADFLALSEPLEYPRPFNDSLLDLQYRDLVHSKIPRALRFNDRAAMRSAVELRAPFLDPKVVEFAFGMPREFKIQGSTRKWLLRQLARELAPDTLAEAPKRPVQTPQREWLRGPLRGWAEDQLEEAIARTGSAWLDTSALRASWKSYCAGEGDNSFYVWQWISLGMLAPSFSGIEQNV